MRNAEHAAANSFALIVVNYGSAHLLAENLSSLDVATLGGQVVIVDNFTTAAELHEVRRLAVAHKWTVLALGSNRGFGAAVNAGANLALQGGAEVLVVLNPDASIDARNVARLVAAVNHDPLLMASPIMRTSSGDIWFDGMELYSASGRVASGRRRPLLDEPSEPWLTGACFALAATLWHKVGGFDEDYFLYWEDVDLSRRVVEVGGRLAVLKDALAVHDPGGTQSGVGGTGTKSEIYYFYNIRNRLVYAAKHLDGRLQWAWVISTPRVAYEVLCRGGRRQLLSSIAPWRAYVSGILSGYLMLVHIRRRVRHVSLSGQAPGRAKPVDYSRAKERQART